MLDTQEIQNRYTKEHLLAHIQKVLSEYDIDVENNHRLTLNFNATNTNDIHEQDIESDNEINYLENEKDHAELTINNDDDKTQMEDLGFNIMTEENTQNTQNSGPVTSTQYHVLTDVCDNASEIAEAINKLGQYKWFGCVGHHINIIAQAGFKQLQDAATLVKKCQKIVEHIPASKLLINFQDEVEQPLQRVLQENGTTWWSILLMMRCLTQKKDLVDLTLVRSQKANLVLSPIEEKETRLIIRLLTPFERSGEKLSSEDNVTISLIISIFETLGEHLKPNNKDITLIAQMKTKMLIKFNNRYTPVQMKCLKICTLLDVRYKCEKFLAPDFDRLEADMKHILEDQNEQSTSTSTST